MSRAGWLRNLKQDRSQLMTSDLWYTSSGQLGSCASHPCKACMHDLSRQSPDLKLGE